MIDYSPDQPHRVAAHPGAAAGEPYTMTPLDRLLRARAEGRLPAAIKFRIRRMVGPVANRLIPDSRSMVQAPSEGGEKLKVLRQLSLLAEQQDNH